ncbi:beta-N-acetylhexosaminidase [Sandaracinus amylolyticus]|uniref:Beta-hexosaminidase n=1 Tax=Sandaracinus amylolyticus TaxID=927083 RepID=A0A0F6YKB2_9BACT|nr:beta-N-acetylhexosaminidase [Sandaracinus amylolyticus]AKF09078.1 Beta-hexosaminidase [Sandaracinus amylolyticus]
MTNDAIRRAAGRVLIVGFPGRVLPAPLAALAAEGALGGVILFKRNLGTITEIAAVIDAVHDAFGAGHVPLVSIDQEGGRVARLGAPFVKLPPMRVLGTRDDVALTRRAARVLGTQLRALGIGVDFAPVLDVDTNPANPVIGDRSFGREPDVVIRHALAFAEGLGDAGVLACGKHFPGHGDTDLDSHLALPRIAHDRARLDRVELAPFRAARAKVPTIMTAHVVFDAIDPTVPATLSRAVIEGVLRGELGYDGVIVSDDLEMKAVADRWGVAGSAVRAIDAGCDALLVCATPERVIEAHAALVARAERDDAFAERLDVAARRVDALPRVPRPAPDVLARIDAAGGAEIERALTPT